MHEPFPAWCGWWHQSSCCGWGSPGIEWSLPRECSVGICVTPRPCHPRPTGEGTSVGGQTDTSSTSDSVGYKQTKQSHNSWNQLIAQKLTDLTYKTSVTLKSLHWSSFLFYSWVFWREGEGLGMRLILMFTTSSNDKKNMYTIFHTEKEQVGMGAKINKQDKLIALSNF